MARENNTRATLLARHHVRDYAAWKQIYDSAAGLRKDGGVLVDSVYQGKGDPNAIMVTHRFASMAAAEAWVANPALAEALSKSGVEGAPTFEFSEEV